MGPRSGSTVVARAAARLTFAVIVIAAAGGSRGDVALGDTADALEDQCPVAATAPAYAARVMEALRARRDIWGERLLRRPDGPSYAGAAAFLRPLLLAGAPGRTPLTDSGAYYLPFGEPDGPRGTSAVALHVADGSQIVSRRIGGDSLTVHVGAEGAERYGSCVARLTRARLAEGWLPIVETRYRDAVGARYLQESLAARVRGTSSLASLVRIAVDTRQARSAVTVRLTPSDGAADRLRPGPGGVRDGPSVVHRIPQGTTRTVHVAWLADPAAAPTVDEETYDDTRAAVASSWTRRVGRGMTIDVPERVVANASRALRARALLLAWRYSVGNPYEQFSFPESPDIAVTLAEQGFREEARGALLYSLTRPERPYPSFRMGAKLLAFARCHRLHRDAGLVREATPVLRRYVTILGRQIEGNATGLVDRERYSSDIPDVVYGLHAQALVWAGLREMAGVWSETGRRSLATTSARLATRLGAGLRRAIAASQRRLSDGSLFVPARLLDGERTYESVTEERLGSYWNLVMPYAFATGLLPPGSGEARGVLRYLELHGSRLLGVIRSGAYPLYERPVHPVGGINPVYSLQMSRFLADNDKAGELVLSLYGQLAAAMTPHTFVSGEAVSVAPLSGTAERATYLPPNSAAAASFLTTLRLMLVHETRDREGRPLALRLAFATPRAWLAPGRRIAVRNAPTSFGPVSFSIVARTDSATVTVETPRRATPRALVIRLRLPSGKRVAGVTLGGRTYRRFDAPSGTVDLSARRGTLRLRVAYR